MVHGPKIVDPRLAKNYVPLSSDEQKEVYREWAPTYDQELIEEFGYAAPQQAVNIFSHLVPDRSKPILDMGCGTGLAGQLLAEGGYQHIDGIDLSPEMLDKARALGVYKSLSEGDLSADLEIPQIYQAVICVGVFSHKPEQADQAARLLDCLRPGGLLVATVNGKGWDDLDWDTLLEGSRRRHGFSIDSLEDIPYLVKQGIRGCLLYTSPSPRDATLSRMTSSA